MTADVCQIAEPAILTVDPRGIKKRAVDGSTFSSSSATFIDTGIVAALDEVENARSIGAEAFFRNSMGEIRFIRKISNE